MKSITLSMLLLPMLGTAESAKPTALMEGKVETNRTIILGSCAAHQPGARPAR